MGHITKIFIIQSLKTTDKLKSGEELNKQISATILTDFKNVETDDELFAQLDKIRDELKNERGQYILHFDCHGNNGGIVVFDKSDNPYFIAWEKLRDNLREIYLSSDIKPIVSFSSCKGFNAVKLVACFKPCPYYLVTGSLKSIGFQDSVDGYLMFYKNIDTGRDYMDNVGEVRSKFPNLDFASYTAEQLLEIGWKNYLQTELTPDKIKKRTEKIKAEFIASEGKITKEQEDFIDNQFTKQGTDKP